MRLLLALSLLVAACDHPQPASPPANASPAPVAAARPNAVPPTAGWTAADGAGAIAAAERAIRGAPMVAIAAPSRRSSGCLDSIADAMEVAVIASVRGKSPQTAIASDQHTGFGATAGYLVAAVEPRPSHILIGDCLGQGRFEPAPATVTAFVVEPDLDAARAEAARLAAGQ